MATAVRQRHFDLVALAAVAHVEAPRDGHFAGGESAFAEKAQHFLGQQRELAVEVGRGQLVEQQAVRFHGPWLSGLTSIPNADMTPAPDGKITCGILSLRAIRSAWMGPQPPKATMLQPR